MNLWFLQSSLFRVDVEFIECFSGTPFENEENESPRGAGDGLGGMEVLGFIFI